MAANVKVLEKLVALLADDSQAFRQMGIKSLSAIDNANALQVAFDFFTQQLLPSDTNGSMVPRRLDYHTVITAIETLLCPESHFTAAPRLACHLIAILTQQLQVSGGREDYCVVDTVTWEALSRKSIREACSSHLPALIPLLLARLHSVTSFEASAICCSTIAAAGAALPPHEQDRLLETAVLQELLAVPSRATMRRIMVAVMLLQAILQDPFPRLMAHLAETMDRVLSLLEYFVCSPLTLVSPDAETLSLFLHGWQSVARMLEMAQKPLPTPMDGRASTSPASLWSSLASRGSLRTSLSLGLRPSTPSWPRTPSAATPCSTPPTNHHLLPAPQLCAVVQLCMEYLKLELLPRSVTPDADLDDDDPGTPVRELCCRCLVSVLKCLWHPSSLGATALPYVTSDIGIVLETCWDVLFSGAQLASCLQGSQGPVVECIMRAFLWMMEYSKAYVLCAISHKRIKLAAENAAGVLPGSPPHPFLSQLAPTLLETLKLLTWHLKPVTEISQITLSCASLASFLFHASFCAKTTSFQSYIIRNVLPMMAFKLKYLMRNAHNPGHSRSICCCLRVLCILFDDRLFPAEKVPQPDEGEDEDSPLGPTVSSIASTLLMLVEGASQGSNVHPDTAQVALLTSALLVRRHQLILAEQDMLDSLFTSLINSIERLSNQTLLKVGHGVLVDIASQAGALLGHDVLSKFFATFTTWTTSTKSQLSAINQILFLGSSTLPPSVAGALGGDLVALVLATQQAEEFQNIYRWPMSMSQSISFMNLGLEHPQQDDDVLPAGRLLSPDVGSLQSLAQADPDYSTVSDIQVPEICTSPNVRRAPSSIRTPLRKSAYLPMTMSRGTAPLIPTVPLDCRTLAVSCLRALIYLLSLRLPTAFSTLQFTQFLHFVANFLQPSDTLLAALATDVATEVIKMHDMVNWRKVSQPLVLQVMPAVTSLLASGIVGDDSQLEASYIQLYNSLSVAATEDQVDTSSIAAEYRSLVAATGESDQKSCVVFDYVVVANSALLACNVSLPCQHQQPAPDEVARLHATECYVEKRPEVLRPVAKCISALITSRRSEPRNKQATRRRSILELDDLPDEEEDAEVNEEMCPEVNRNLLRPADRKLLSTLIDGIMLFPKPGKPPPETSGLWLGLHCLAEVGNSCELLELFPDRKLYTIFISYFIVEHETIPILAAQALGRCCAHGASSTALTNLLADCSHGRRYLKAMLTAAYHATTSTTAPTVNQNLSGVLMEVAHNSSSGYSEDESALATASLARLSVFDTLPTFQNSLRPLACLSSPEEDRRILLSVFEALFEDDAQILHHIDRAVFRVHATAIFTSFLSAWQPPVLQQRAVQVLTLACDRHPWIFFCTVDLEGLLSRMAQAYVSRVGYDEEAAFHEVAVEKTKLKGEILQFVRLLGQTPLEDEAFHSEDDANVLDAASTPCIIHLLPDGPLVQLHTAISTKVRDNAPPPDSALRREVLLLLQNRLGFSNS